MQIDLDAERDCAACASRRAFLALTAKALMAAPAAGLLGACGVFDDAEIRIGTLEKLKETGVLQAEFNGDIIETRLDEHTKPYTLNLICTHKGCTVEYQDDKHEYRCPCHKGRYDAKGKVLGGKPPKPLHKLRTELRGAEVWVLNETV
jgi:Rieske Fe-S protein